MNKKIITTFIILLAVVVGVSFFMDGANNKNNSSSTLSTYTSDEYGFSFKYPENVTIYEKGAKEFSPRLEDSLVVWGETDETYDNNIVYNSNTPYRITILEGRHPSELEDYDKVTSIKAKNNKSFTIRYRGPTSALSDPVQPVVDAYEIISESFEIK